MGHFLSQYDMHFLPQKAIKGRAIADFMAENPAPGSGRLYEDIPDESAEVHLAQTTQEDQVWQMFFDGASRVNPSGDLAAGVGIVLVSPHHHVIPRAFTLTKPCSNNVAEYNALLIGMKIAHGLGIKNLEAYSDSQLIVCQVQGLYAVRKPDLIPYYEATMQLAQKFKNFYVEHLPRRQNTHADALASLATSLGLPPGATEKIWIYTHDLFCPDPPYEGIPLLPSAEALQVAANSINRDWRFPYIDYCLFNILPDDPQEAAAIRRKAIHFYYDAASQTLYRRAREGPLLRCLFDQEAVEVLQEAHDGVCGAHQPGPKLGDRIRRMGYYWPKMMTEAIAYAKKCHACQIHGDFVHQLPEQQHPTDSTWPFEMWGMDIMGPISPPSAKDHRFILAVTDYFSKWAEAIPLREVKTSDVIQFIKHHVIYRFGVPRRIVHDNGPQFVSYSFQRFCPKFGIQSTSSTAYYPPANGLTEAFNKTIGKLLKKFVSRTKRDWDEKLGECLWAYRTTVRTPTKATPFSLVYGAIQTRSTDENRCLYKILKHSIFLKSEPCKSRLSSEKTTGNHRYVASQNTCS